MFQTMIINFMRARFCEPSTWRGLIAIAMGFGIHISPAMQNVILFVGLLLMGGTGALTPDVLNKCAPKAPEAPALAVPTSKAFKSKDQVNNLNKMTKQG